MAYNPINFNNGQAGGTPLSASNLRHVENGIVSAHNDIATLTANVNSLSERYGTPLVAHTASEMTDTAKIYVYVGSETGYTTGNWYYYDGDSWESGGAYNSTAVNTDTTLTQENMAADAKKVGDEISDLKSQIKTSRSISSNTETPLTLAWNNEGLNSDGAVIESSWNQSTDYIELITGTDLIFTNTSASNNVYLYAYDENHLKVGRDVLYGAGSIQTSATGAKYVKAMTYSESVAQADQGTYVTAIFFNKYSEEFTESAMAFNALSANDIFTGFIQEADGIIIPATNRTTTKYLPLLKGTRITGSRSWGVAFGVYRYDPVTKEFVEKLNADWLYDYTIPVTGLYRLMFGVTNTSTISQQMKFTYNPATINTAIVPFATQQIISPSELSKTQSTTIKTIAHRGLWKNGHGMMCGASAVIAAKKYGYLAVENDVNLTSDGYMVMWHDADLSVIGRSDVVIRNTTLATLKSIDVGTYYSTKFAGEKIMTFDEWIQLCHKVGVDARIDFKISGADFTDSLAQQLVQSVKRAGMLNNVSYTTNFDKIRQYHPNAKLVFLGNPTADNVQSFQSYKADGEFWYCPFAPDLTAEMANLALDNGYGLETWFADYAYYEYTTKTAIFNEIYRIMNFGISKITLDDYRIEDVIAEKVLN